MKQETITSFLKAAHNRHSVRNFLTDDLSNESLSELDNFIKNLEVPFAHNTDIRRFKAETGKKLYNNGINTCWFGHYKLQELAATERMKETTWGMGYGYRKVVDVGERAIACIACGYANSEAKRLVDKVASRNGIGRKPLRWQSLLVTSILNGNILIWILVFVQLIYGLLY